jgi:hypothetical protein
MTSGIIDGVRVSFTQSGGNFSLGSATDASVRSAVSIADGTTVYYVAVGIDANGAEIEREVGEGAISSTGTVITPASRSWSTSGVGVGHTFTAVTKVLTLGVTRAMLDLLCGLGVEVLGSDTIAPNFATASLKTRAAGGTITLNAATGMVAGRPATVIIDAGASTRTISSGSETWVWMTPEPTTLPANKRGVLGLTSTGTTDGAVYASWLVEP